MKPIVAVATFLGGVGPTGVETHFNQILRDVAERGGDARLVTPYTGPRLHRALFRPLKNARSERGSLLYARCQAVILKQQLAKIFAEAGEQSLTVYAQSPAAAEVALAARAGRPGRVMMVVHYNISECDEIINKGLARPGGPWCRHLERVERETLPKLDALVFGCDFMRRTVSARVPAIAAVPQQVIFNFAPPPPAENQGKTPIRDLLAIGTLEPRKNQGFLLQVLAAARDDGHRYTLTLVGDGPDRKKLEQLTRELNLGDQVTFAGFQRHASALIPGHRMLVHAAKQENCPLIIPEALSYGRPVAAAPVGGIPEMIRDGVESIHWDLAQPGEAARRLAALLEDRPRYAAAAAAARARYDDAFACMRERWLNFLAPPSESSPASRP